MKRSSDPEPAGTDAGGDPQAGGDADLHGDAGSDDAGRGRDVVWEEAAAEAEGWLAGCRVAEAAGRSSHAVGAGPIGDPGLAAAVAQLAAGVDGLVCLDGGGRDGQDLLEALAELHRHSQRLVGAVAGLTGWYNASREWMLKAGSAAARLAHRVRTPGEDMRAQVRLGKNLTHMPLVAAALAEGTVGVCHAKKLARLVTCRRTRAAFVEDEALLVGWAQTLGWEEFCTRLAYWQLEHDPDGAQDNAAVDEERRRVHLSPGIDGTGILDGILTPVGHATVREALERIDRELFQDDWAEARERLGRDPTVDELTRSPAQRRHDALVRMAQRSQTADPHGKRPLPLVSILMGYETFAGALSEIEQTGTVVSPGTLVKLLQDHGHVVIERAVFEGPNRLVELSDRRLFTGALRRAIKLRDRTCTWPGCTVPAVHCQIDHVVPDCEGGPTSLDNGQAMCGRQNRMKERIRKLMARRRRRQQTPTQHRAPPAHLQSRR